MLKDRQVLYKASGEEMTVIDISKNQQFICRVKKTYQVSYNNRQEKQQQIRYVEEVFHYNDIGIKVFFDKLDIYEDPSSLDEKYHFNFHNIKKHHHNKSDELLNRLNSDVPIKPMSQVDKEKIIFNYSNDEAIVKEEQAFFKIADSEYFARIDLDTEYYQKGLYKKKHYYDRIYISKTDHYKQIDDVHIVNWRAPIASIYYDTKNTKFTFNHYVDIVNKDRIIVDSAGNKSKVPWGNKNNVYNYELMLKRNLSFNPFRYSNVYIIQNKLYIEGSVDPFLLDLIAENRLKHEVTDIIKSIQSNQNQIIRLKYHQHMVVQGCAGSGKTMILLHRISYLKYNKFLRNISKIKIITPNNSFSEFISPLTHNLEIDKINQLVIEDYYLSLIDCYQDENKEYNNNKLTSGYTKGLQWLANLKKNYVREEEVEIEDKLNIYYSNHTLNKVESLYKDRLNNVLMSKMIQDLFKIFAKLNLEVDINQDTLNNSVLKKILSVCQTDLKKKLDERNNNVNEVKEQIENIELNKEHTKNINLLINKQKELSLEQMKLNDTILTILLNLLQNYEDLNYFNTVLETANVINQQVIENNENIQKEIELQKESILNDIASLEKRLNSLNIWNRKSKEKIELQIENKKFLYDNIEKNEVDIALESENQKLIQQLKNELKDILSNVHELSLNDIISNINEIIEDIFKSINKHKLEYYRVINDEEFNLESFRTYFLTIVNSFDKQITTISNQVSFYFSRLDRVVYEARIKQKDEILLSKLQNLIAGLQIIDTEESNLEFISKATEFVEEFNKIIKDINITYSNIIIEANRSYNKRKLLLDDLYSKLKEKQSLLLTDDENNIVEEAVKFLSNKAYLIFEIFESILIELRKQLNHIKLDKLYKQDIFILLYIHYLHFSPLKETDGFIFIDEAQDYSYNEYKLIHLVNKKQIIFNIFGDNNQLLSQSRGIDDWNLLKELLNYQYFELNENYRNTVQITELCNKQFDFDHKPIGIKGPVAETIEYKDIKYLIAKEIKSNPKLRVAVISKNKDRELKKYIHNLNQNSKSKIFYDNVKAVKGLEFDTVFVIDDIKNKNELYISYTRALNKLYIVKNENISK